MQLREGRQTEKLTSIAFERYVQDRITVQTYQFAFHVKHNIFITAYIKELDV